jgi:ribosomal protein S18 acetylase RimI-like enzyme
MSVTIRNAVFEDIDIVQNFSLTDELKNPNGDPQKKWWFEAFIKEKQIFFVAEKDKKIIGFVLAERTVGNCILIQDIFVENTFRGMGIGKILMDKVESEAIKNKYKLIYTYSDVENKKTS